MGPVSSSSRTAVRQRCAFICSKMPPWWPAGIQLLPPHFGQRPRKAMFFPQSGQMITSECDSSNFCSPSASRLLRNVARLPKVSSRDIPAGSSAGGVPEGLPHVAQRVEVEEALLMQGGANEDGPHLLDGVEVLRDRERHCLLRVEAIVVQRLASVVPADQLIVAGHDAECAVTLRIQRRCQ